MTNQQQPQTEPPAGHPTRYREVRRIWVREVTRQAGPSVAEWCGGTWDELNQRVVGRAPAPGLPSWVAELGAWVGHDDAGLGAWDPAAPELGEGEPLFFVIGHEALRRGYETDPGAEPR